MAKKRLLTKELRSTILYRLIDAVRKERSANLLKKEHALAAKLRTNLIGKHAKAMDALPANFFSTRNSVAVHFEYKENGHRKTESFFNGYRNSGDHLHFSEGALLPAFCANSTTVERDSAIGKQLYDLKQEYLKMGSDLTKLEEKVEAVLAGYTTVDALLVDHEYLTIHVPAAEPKPTLPMVQAGEVKKLIACAKKGTCEEAA